MISEILTNIPETWELTRLENICLVNPKLDKTKFEDELTVSFVPMPAVGAENGAIDVSEVKLFHQVKKGYTPFIEGDVLFAKITPCMENGKSAVVPELIGDLGFGSTEFHVFRSHTGFSEKFLYYFVSSKLFRVEAEHNMTGAVGQRRVPALWLSAFKIPVPPSNEQIRIVEKIEELFSELDKGIENLRTAKAQLAVYRQALLKHAFEGKLTEQWRKDNSDKLESPEQILARIQQEREARYQQQLDEWKQEVEQWETEGGEGKKPSKPRKFVEPEGHTEKEINILNQLPKEWKWGKLGSVFDVYVGATPSRKCPEYWEGDIPWVSSGEVAFTKIAKTSESITNEGITNSSTVKHPVGTVMLAMIGEGKTRGQAAILEIEAAHNQNTAAIRVSETNFSSLVVYYYLMYQYEITRKLGSGNNQKALNKERVSNMNFPLFCTLEQEKLVEIIESNLATISQIELELDLNLKRAEVLRQSILKKAFSGQLVPQNSDDEPASELLKKIAIEKAELAEKEKAEKAAARKAKAAAKKAKA